MHAFATRPLLTTLLLLVGITIALLWAAPWLLNPKTVGPAVAPDPATHPGAVVQVYGADVWGMRGRFAIHTWIATKAQGEADYEIAQVIGWRQRRGHSVVSITQGRPDVPWFRSPPKLLFELRDDNAAAHISNIRAAIGRYPYADEYTMWPGPNSNSFTAWVALEVPELKFELPMKAIGESWMRSNYSIAKTLIESQTKGH